MKSPTLSRQKILYSLMLFVLHNSLAAHANTAISVPNEVRLLMDSVKGDYQGIQGREWRHQQKTHLSAQVKTTKAELDAEQKKYEKIQASRVRLVDSFAAAGIMPEEYETFTDVQQMYLNERDSFKQIEYLQEQHEKALSEQKSFLDELSNEPIYASFYSGMKYYGWKDKDGNSGHQTLIPFGTWMGNGKYSLGIYGNYVFAKNSLKGYSGSMHTLADTMLSLNRRIEKSNKEEFEFFLNINLPTGKSALNVGQRNARMTDDLVEVDKFGSTWDFNPGVNYVWRPFKYDKWTFGTNFLFKRSYDTTSDMSHDESKDGREWRRFIRYQHAEEKWQFVFEVHNTGYNRNFNQRGYHFDTKDEWRLKLTYNKQIAKDQELLLYYWPEYQTPNESATYTNSPASWSHFYGVRWSKFIGKRSTLRLSFDVLQSNGLRFNGLRSWYDNVGNPQAYYNEVTGRDKYTVGIGFDHKFKNNDKLTFDIRYFWMHDGVSTFGEPKQRYKGLNVFLMYHKNLTFHW